MVTTWSGLCHSLCMSRFNSWKSWHGEINFFCSFITHLHEIYLIFNISSKYNIMGTCANTKMEYDLKGLNSKKLVRRKMTNISPWCTLLSYESCLRPPSSCFTKWQILQFHDLFQCWMLCFFVVLCLLGLHPTLVSW